MVALTQVVYLSNRPAVLAETLTYVRHFSPWLTEAVVLAPRTALAALGELPGVTGVAEEELLSAAELRSMPSDHSVRNAWLRRLLAERGPLHDVFLQSDDDYRPLRPVGAEDFLDGDRLVSYACHDLARWRRKESPYDAVQHATYLALSYLGAPHLNYASHQPQPIDRALFLEAFAAALALDPGGPFCEWSLPLNHGRLVAPERFAAPRTFRTICWPRWPHEGWTYWRRPDDIAYENFHPELYADGGLFQGLDTALDPEDPQRQAFAKLRRWYDFDIDAGRLRFPDGLADPWRTSPGRRGFFGAARRLRKLYEYVALEERTALSELAGSVARLEQERDRH
ncbi:MAG: hypothetical protein ACRDTP_07745 [Mycobacteriales bacterium]